MLTDFLGEEQLYAVLILAHGGTDLEHSTLNDYSEARALLLQVCLSLASVEQSLRFEHRDLHWGNILVKPTETETLTFLVNGRFVSVATRGVQATIIDYTLSRMEKGASLAAYPGRLTGKYICDEA